MRRKWILAAAAVTMVSLAMSGFGVSAWAFSQQGQQEKQPYTPAEYNAYIAGAKETNPQKKIQLFEEFLSKYPDVSLLLKLPAIRGLYQTYNSLKDYAKVVQYTDRMLSYGEKVDVGTRLEAAYYRTLSFNYVFNAKAADANAQCASERAAAKAGLTALSEVKKPDNLTEEQFEQNKKGPTALFNYTSGVCSLQLKEYGTAIDSFRAALAANPNDPLTYFRMGIAYLQMNPPQSMDGFWALARSVALKGPGEAEVRNYLKGQLQRYQLTACPNLVDAEMNEMIQLASNSPERPASYSIPTSTDLQQARDNPANFLPYLKEGGEKGKLMWLATCGLEFPDVAVKVIEVAANDDGVAMKVFRPATGTPEEMQKEMQAATTANMEVKVEGQPEAKGLKKDDYVRFTGTLVGYDHDPFMLHWDKCKINAEDLPSEKASPAKRRTRRPAGRKRGV